MENEIDSLKKNFNKYLTDLGISPESHKNYRSDISHFSGWLILKVRSFGSYIETLTQGVPFLSHDIALEYKNYMLENATPIKTANRRLSTLRHLSRFLVASQISDLDFMDGIENLGSFVNTKETKLSDHPSVNEFKLHLESQKISPNTVKNYLSDIKQFLSWLETRGPLTNSNN